MQTLSRLNRTCDGKDGTFVLDFRNDTEDIRESVFGLANDYASLRKPGRDDRDLFQLHLGGIIAASMGAAAAANVSSYIHTVDRADVCRVHVHPSGFPVDAKVTIDKNGQMIKKTAFYVRASNATRELDNAEKAKYLLGRWPTR